MRPKLLLLALMISTSLLSLGATTDEGWVVCLDTGQGPTILRDFIEALRRDDGTWRMYKEIGCTTLRGGLEVRVLERGDGWIKVLLLDTTLLHPLKLYTVPQAIKE